MPKFYFLILLMLSGLTMHTAYASTNIIGYVKTIEGEAEVSTGKQTIKAVPGTPIHLGDDLKTGEHGAIGITFKDNTIISIGHNTKLTVDQYLYAPAHDDLRLTATLVKGTLHYISGIIAKLKPDNVNIITPTGTIGVRGTHFVVKVGED